MHHSTTTATLVLHPLFWAGLWLGAPAAAQTLPPGQINSPPTTVSRDQSIGAGTTLNVLADGWVGNDFSAGLFEQDNTGVEVNVMGGTVGDRFQAFGGAEVNVSGGSVGGDFHAWPGSTVTLTGGGVGGGFYADSRSEVTLRGGTVGPGFRANSTADVDLVGGDYRLNGAPYDDASITLADGDMFTGVLEDGSPFLFTRDAADSLGDVLLTRVDLPSYSTATIVIDRDVTAPRGLRPGQSLTLLEGGVLEPHFTVIDATMRVDDGVALGIEAVRSTVEINGGSVREYFVANAGSDVTVNGGSFSRGIRASPGSRVSVHGGNLTGGLRAGAGSMVTVTGGQVGNLRAESGSKVTITGGDVSIISRAESGSSLEVTGGTFGYLFHADSGSEVSIAGGSFGARFTSHANSTVTITGGSFANGFTTIEASDVAIRGGSFAPGFSARADSRVELVGTEFYADGVLLPLTPGASTVFAERGVTLSGQLEDGSPFDFELNREWVDWHKDNFAPGALLTLTLVPEPSTCAGALLLAISGAVRRR